MHLVFINSNFLLEYKTILLELLRSTKMFFGIYAEMPVFDPNLVTHQLKIKEGIWPIK